MKKGSRRAAAYSGPRANTAAVQPPSSVPHNGSDPALAEKIKELVRLAQEQGHLTYSDLNEVLPDNAVTPEILDDVFSKLRTLEIEIVDPAEVDRVKTPDSEEEDTDRLDVFDDPVRSYFRQMGQIALLTREQEVEIYKRIEAAEIEVRKIIYGLGFAGKEHVALAEKLLPIRRANDLIASCSTTRWTPATRISACSAACWRASANWIRTWTATTPLGGTPT